MVELYQSLGLKQNIFSRFSAEEEQDYLKNVYINPKYFNSLFSDLKSGSSRFVIGSRGSGKTALMLQLKEALENSNVFVIFIDNFDTIPTINNEKELLFNVVQKMVVDFCLTISKTPSILKKLDKFDKEKLAFFIEQFFIPLSRNEYEDRINRVNKFKTTNFFKNIWNNFLNKPINFLISGAVEVLADTVTKSLGLPKSSNNDFFKNYIPSISTVTPKSKGGIELYDYESLKKILISISLIIKKVGFENSVILFDKIDEYKALKGSINDVSFFIEGLLKDTNLLMTTNFSLVFSIWDEVRNDLSSKGIRFDKFRPIDVTWTNDEIKDILNKRISYFGSSKTIDNLLEDSNEISQIIELANNSPRDLLHLFATIYDEQSAVNSSSSFFTSTSLAKGKVRFCKEYEYYALFPTKRTSKDDVIRNINRLLKTGKTTLKTTDFVTFLKVSTPTAISYIKIMQDYNFVKLTEQQYEYEIADPKIKYLIEKSITQI